jgi:hypothetical protein
MHLRAVCGDQAAADSLIGELTMAKRRGRRPSAVFIILSIMLIATFVIGLAAILSAAAR